MRKNHALSKKFTGKRSLSPYIFCISLFFILCPIYLAAQEKIPGEYLTVRIVEIGPGDEFFSWWGHLAVMVDNELTGESLCYDFGVFSFDDPHLVRNFLKGDLNYKVMVSTAQDELEWYIKNNRDITVYTLNLDSRQKEQIIYALNWNVLPENRNYVYKLFTDNCVTRVIYIIDKVLEGKFTEKYKNENGRFTLREHAERHLYRSAVMYVILNFIMGGEIDKPVSRFEEMFLPSEFTAAIVDFTYTDAKKNRQLLVSSIEKINTAVGRPVVLSKPPRGELYAFFAGMTGAVVLILLVMFEKKHRSVLIISGIVKSLITLYWALAGTVLFYAMFFSHHTYTYNNLNIIYANPLLFFGVPLGILSAFKKQEHKRIFYSRVLKGLWTYILFGCVFTIILRISGVNRSDNTLNLFLIIPSAAVLSFLEDLAVMVQKKLRLKQQP
ncbi:DUF4105 domain-containing protein [Treponema sp. TIM-1]|uniref:lipoprotein N-acyltransferase Lnb domain-containing protein n=1 Tax=Treponema sp. TIM-1 TaxID=2898417 RepID=UPI003980F65B